MSSSPPQFSEPAGTFTVDYRDHDGTIVLGQGDWRFATRWSSAGNGTIHAYRNGGPRVAVAPGVSTIEQVTAEVFSSANFSSRARTPREGEVVLWLNDKGFAAAVEVRKVRVTSESESGTVLEGRYRILTDGGRNFFDPLFAETAGLEQALREGLQAFENLVDVEAGEFGADEIGIGHNRPPSEFVLTKADFSSTAAELKATLLQPKSETQLRRTYDTVVDAVHKIRSTIVRRLQLIEEGFFRQIGSSIALATVLAGWLAYSGELEKVARTILAVGAKLFGWQ